MHRLKKTLRRCQRMARLHRCVSVSIIIDLPAGFETFTVLAGL